jgi:hypothetical protein
MERPIRGRTRYPPAQDSGTARIGVPAVSGPDWRQLNGKQDTRGEPRTQSPRARPRVLGDGNGAPSCSSSHRGRPRHASRLPESYWPLRRAGPANLPPTLLTGTVPSAPPPTAGSANGRWRPSIHGAKRGVESPNACEPRRERDRGHRHHGLVHQSFRALNAPGRCDRGRRRTCVPHEQSAQMSGRHPKRIGEILDALAIVQESALDEPQSACDGRRSSMPRRRPGCGLGSTPQAGAEARALGGSRGGEENDVVRLGGLDRTRGATIDPCGQHASEEPPVEPTVSRDPRTITCLCIKGEGFAHNSASLARKPASTAPSGR